MKFNKSYVVWKTYDPKHMICEQYIILKYCFYKNTFIIIGDGLKHIYLNIYYINIINVKHYFFLIVAKLQYI